MLYFVATPIGNLEEISFRAVNVLRSSDIIYAEDTRHSAVLTAHYQITAPLVSYQKFNERARLDEIIGHLKNGKAISVISDAGMPLISDPGSPLVERLIEEGLEYTVVSGACALINALVLSGLSTQSFFMAGFLPSKKSDCDKLLAQIRALKSTLVFYVPPHDILKVLDILHNALGERRAAVVREISKKFEAVHRGSLGGEFGIVQKGEMVLVVEGATQSQDSVLNAADELRTLLGAGVDKKDAIKLVAKELGIPKTEVYKISLTL